MEMESELSYLHNELVARQKHIKYIEKQLMKMDKKYTQLQQIHRSYKQQVIAQKDSYLSDIGKQVNEYKQKYKNLYEKYAQMYELKIVYEEQLKQMKKKLKEQKNINDKLGYNNRQLMNQCRKYKEIKDTLTKQNQQFWAKLLEIEKQQLIIKAQNQQLKALLFEHTQKLTNDYQHIKTVINQQKYQNHDTLKTIDNKISIYKQSQIDFNPQNIKTIPNNYSYPDQNLWKHDMVKIKNAIEYGNHYFCNAFDPSVLDMLTSRQIYTHIRKITILNQKLNEQIVKIKRQNQEQLIVTKQKINKVIEQLNVLQNQRAQKIKLNIGVQTQDNIYNQIENKLDYCLDFNNRLRIKNHSYFQLLNKLVVYAAGLHQLLEACHNKIKYYKNFEKLHSWPQIQNKKREKTRLKLRKVLISIYFIKCLSTHKSHKSSRQQYAHKFKTNLDKPMMLLIHNQQKIVQNMELIKIKQEHPKTLMTNQFQNQLISNSVSYCLHKINKDGQQLDIEQYISKYLWKAELRDNN